MALLKYSCSHSNSIIKLLCTIIREDHVFLYETEKKLFIDQTWKQFYIITDQESRRNHHILSKTEKQILSKLPNLFIGARLEMLNIIEFIQMNATTPLLKKRCKVLAKVYRSTEYAFINDKSKQTEIFRDWFSEKLVPKTQHGKAMKHELTLLFEQLSLKS